MKKKDIKTAGALQAYVRQKAAAALHEIELRSEIYNSVLLTKKITKDDHLVDWAYDKIKSWDSLLQRASSSDWSYKELQEGVKEVDRALSQLRRFRKIIEDEYVFGDNLENHRKKIAAKTAEVTRQYELFTTQWRPKINQLVSNKNWSQAAIELHKLPAMPDYIEIEDKYFVAASDLNVKNREIIAWKISVKKKIPKQYFLTMRQEVGSAKITELTKELHNELKKYEIRVRAQLKNGMSNTRKDTEEETSPELARIIEIERMRERLSCELHWNAKDIKSLPQKADSPEIGK